MRTLLSLGLIVRDGQELFAASAEARAWLRREAMAEHGFRSQHGQVEAGAEGDGAVFVNLDESPVATLARRRGNDGKAWLPDYLVVAAERLRRDFEIGQLQPRVTANWSASVATGRRGHHGSTQADLTETALAGRLRFDAAMRAVGPELSGLLIDICCLLKGLETVERERRWPVRSAKLVLRLALQGLARHYGLSAAATGAPAARRVRRWGAEDYRPKIG